MEKLNITDLAWDDLKRPDLAGWLASLRGSDIRVLRLRFTALPWTSYLLCTPKGHIVGMHNKLLSSTHQRWMAAFVSPQNITDAFVKEHQSRGIKLAEIPLNFYAYGSGDAAEPAVSRIGWKVEPLCELLFEPYLVPQTEECEAIFLARLEWAADSLGWFFIRPFPEEQIDDQALYSPSSLDYQLFESPPRQFEESCLLLVNAIEDVENGVFMDKDALQCATSYEGWCVFPIHSYTGERIAALRARLVRLLGWPLFYASANKYLKKAKQLYIKERHLYPREIKYNVVEELEAYLAACDARYPILKSDPFLEVWQAKRMPTRPL